MGNVQTAAKLKKEEEEAGKGKKKGLLDFLKKRSRASLEHVTEWVSHAKVSQIAHYSHGKESRASNSITTLLLMSLIEFLFIFSTIPFFF